MGNDNIRFLQPESLEEARAILSTLTDRSVILAGGTDLMIELRERRPELDSYLSLWQLKELRKVEKLDGWLKIGAMVTHTQASEHPIISSCFSALSVACGKVGSKQIRNKGTLGGNLMNGSAASDTIPCICLFGGELEFLQETGVCRVPVEAYLKDKRRWRNPHTLLTALYLPVSEKQESCFLKLGRREEVTIAQISLCASWVREGGEKRHMRIAAGGVSPVPLLYDTLPQLEGRRISEAAAEDLAQMLRQEIQTIRLNRKRPSKLKVTPAEQLYKERAVRGVVFDLVEQINAI